MTLQDRLEASSQPGHGRAIRCRICHLIEQLPESEADVLRRYTSTERTTGPKPIHDALLAEGYDVGYHAVKHHLYVCQASR